MPDSEVSGEACAAGVVGGVAADVASAQSGTVTEPKVPLRINPANRLAVVR